MRSLCNLKLVEHAPDRTRFLGEDATKDTNLDISFGLGMCEAINSNTIHYTRAMLSCASTILYHTEL